MHPREGITEIFSTFVQFEADHFSHWAVEPKLHRSMRRCLEQSFKAPSSEAFWALYWYKLWQDSSPQLATLHLSAYLQETGYWTALQAIKKFTNPRYTLADYFQMAIAEVETVLQDFKPEKGASLKTYAAMAFSSLLTSSLRQRHEVDICSNWSLLRKISKKRLVEALQQAGLAPTTIAQYRLAWICFNQIYVQAVLGEKLPPPNRSVWEAIAKLYNTERHHQLTSLSSDCQPEMLERWLTNCAGWVRAYLYPPINSLNALKPNWELGEVQDDLPDLHSESLLSELVAQEEMQTRRSQRSHLHQALIAALAQLDSQSRKILHLYYSESWTQQQIMQECAMSQASVSRRLTKARESLLTALVQWSQEKLHSSPTSIQIKDMSMALEEWLKMMKGG
ncbi:sigma-70 family RNA polymerase sigma factor [Trichocoleus sp. FACHB-591]|uniref:sigma-70 family RNA polymerase sigma factor n=1 Tax=Trichocoleus sp. FACHB-591 TaxID=2692872 RepID=UPI001682567C|nr:sigma-70 family RNA polymerase sigma factor [Trichocoleus sp. FACHB-591]MBD2095822.1 sigma-70 family RNA polymerase sigma factor [Trichocoleus sp. FACHB-591]